MYIYIYIYIVRLVGDGPSPSSSSVLRPSSRRRRPSSVCPSRRVSAVVAVVVFCPSVRPVVHPIVVVVVRHLSVRSVFVFRPLSFFPVVRLKYYYITSLTMCRMGIWGHILHARSEIHFQWFSHSQRPRVLKMSLNQIFRKHSLL